MVSALALRRLALEKEHFGPTTNIIKFLCRDIWTAVFGSSIERLQTNNFGMYVLHHSSHSPLLTLSSPEGDTDTAALAHLLFPCGLIKGFLGAFGVDASVDARVTGCHAAYHIQMRQYGEDLAPSSQAAPVSSSTQAPPNAPAEPTKQANTAQ